jgi:hypothetical protein
MNNEPTIKPKQKITIHRDGSVSYWSVYLQQWQRVSAMALTDRHDDYAALTESDRAKISRAALQQ